MSHDHALQATMSCSRSKLAATAYSIQDKQLAMFSSCGLTELLNCVLHHWTTFFVALTPKVYYKMKKPEVISEVNSEAATAYLIQDK